MDKVAAVNNPPGLERIHTRLYESARKTVAAVNALIDLSGSGSSSGGGNSVAVAVDFGAAFNDKAQTVVTGQAWVAAGSEIVGQVLTPAGVDPDEMRLLDMRVVISDIVPGDGFTATVYSETEAKGSYTVACIGV